MISVQNNIILAEYIMSGKNAVFVGGIDKHFSKTTHSSSARVYAAGKTKSMFTYLPKA